MLLLSKKKEKEKRKIAYSSTLSILIERVLYNNIENWLQFFPPFSKNQPKIDRPRCSTPSIHPSIHRFMLSLSSNLNPCCLLQKRSFISIDSFNHYTASTILDSLLLRPTVFHQFFLLLLLLPHPREKFISHFPSTQRTLHSPPLDPPRISRSSAPLCSTSLFFHVASHRNGRVHACPRQ